MKITRLSLMVLVCAVLSSARAGAQQSASGIAGAVKDASGRPVAGVTVEAASGALIEKTRTVVTDGQGLYQIGNLPTGTYDVTFSAPGFSTVKNVGIELPSAFTATANAALKAGNPAETITVTGSTTQVDTQSTANEQVLSSDRLAALPTGQTNLTTAVNLTPGMSTDKPDVGGSEAALGQQTEANKYHGKVGTKVMFDGMRTQNFRTGGFPAYIVNMEIVQGIGVQTGGLTAENASPGQGVNFIPRSGSNSWKFSVEGLGTSHVLNSDNLNSDVRALGLTSTSQNLYKFDMGESYGGPIRRDKIWIYQSTRYWGSKTQMAGIFYDKTEGSPIYTPDPSRPGYRKEWTLSPAATRITWQVSPRNKLNLFADPQDSCVCQASTFGGVAPEAIQGYDIQWHSWQRPIIPTGGFVASWSSPVTSKLLLEAGVGAMYLNFPSLIQPEVTPGAVSILELSTNFRYNSSGGASTAHTVQRSDRYNQRFSATYATGSHALKFGFQNEQGRAWSDSSLTGADRNGVTYRFNKGVPNSVVEYALPYYIKNNQDVEIGLYAQDRWTVKRLTLNFGLRYDTLNQYTPLQTAAAGPYAYSLPARTYAPVYDIPNWKEFSPRLGAAYDLFGNGRTALKVSLGKYLNLTGSNVNSANNPITTSVNSVTRTWNDNLLGPGDPRSGNFAPDCNFANPASNLECGPISDSAFGQNNPKATTYADSLLRGFGAQGNFWEWGVEVQQQISSGITANASFYHNWVHNFAVTDNIQQSPSDFSPYCVTAPIDPRLPGGGGFPVCGLYDISAAKFNSVTNIVQHAAPFVGNASGVNCGYQTPGNATSVTPNGYDVCGVNDFINVSVNARLLWGIRLGGGVDTGRTNRNTCFVVNSPQQLLDCDQVTPFSAQTQVKANVTYPLPFPGQFTISANYQDIPGPMILATYAAPNNEIAPSLGRNLGACGTLAACNATANVPLIAPNTQYEPRRRQLDLKLAKSIAVGKTARLQVNLGVYNVTNAASILTVNTNYGNIAGQQWLQPQSILAARTVQFSGRLNF